MDIQSRKISFIQEFLRLQNEEIIAGLEQLLRTKKKEIYSKEPSPMSIEQFNADIDQSLADVEAGRTITVSDLRAKIAKWG